MAGPLLLGIKAQSFWFLMAAPMLALLGLAAGQVERSDEPVPMALGWGLLATTATGILAIPASGFWLVPAPSWVLLRRGARRRTEPSR